MDYDDLLNQTWEDLPEPAPLPGGGYLIKGTNAAFVKAKEEGQSHKVLLTYKIKEPVTVDADQLADLGEDYDFSVNEATFTIWIESPADWQKVRDHLAIHGVELTGKLFTDNGKLAFAKDFRGAEVIAEVGVRYYQKNGENVPQNTLSKFQRVGE